jgi:hypothetical protein
VNAWNRVHASLWRTYWGAWIFFACLAAIAILSPAPMPMVLRVLGGVLLLALSVSWPLIHVLDIHARRNMDPTPLNGAPAVCGFCNRTQAQLSTLMAGPEQYVCSDCVREAATLLPPSDPPSGGPTLRCSFCQTARPIATVLARGAAALCARCATLALAHMQAVGDTGNEPGAAAAQQLDAADEARASSAGRRGPRS